MWFARLFPTVPPVITGPSENTTIVTTEEHNTTITCEALGFPPPTIVWSKINGPLSDRVSVSDSVSVPTGNGNVTSVSVNLTLTNANREDTGLYQCTASNFFGTNLIDVGVIAQCKYNVMYRHDLSTITSMKSLEGSNRL